MTTAVTKESLAARIAELESGARSLKEDYTLAAYKMLMATMEAEPVAWIVQNKNTGEVEIDEPFAKATNPKYWTDSFPVYRHVQPVVPVVGADLLHTAASAIEDLLTTKDRTGAGVWFDLPFRLRSAANAQPAPLLPDLERLKEIYSIFCTPTTGSDNALSAIHNACRAAMLNLK